MDGSEKKLSEITIGGVVRLLREIAFLAVVGYLSIKLFSGELSMDFTKLSATELVSILLAFFSIGLSAAFYFAAGAQSNQFYDNVNKFTKDTSELLGRVDEQVKGLGGRQSELKASIDKYYFRDRTPNTEAVKEAVEAQAKAAEEKSEIVSEILNKSNLTPTERASFEEKLRDKDRELTKLRMRLDHLTDRDYQKAARDFTQRSLARNLKAFENQSPDEVLFDLVQKGPGVYRKDLARLGFITSPDIDSAQGVTAKGRQMVIEEYEEAEKKASRNLDS